MNSEFSLTAFDADLARQIAACGSIAVLVIEDPEQAVPVARALYEGGVTAIELTFRTAGAADALRRMAREFPELAIGAGTILTPAQAALAKEAGAKFVVAPGLNPAVAKECAALGVSYAPGVMTPSEIEQAIALGCNILKFFPAGVLGGLKTLTTMAAPYKHLGLRYIPLGGITPETTAEYLKSPLIAACGGSWIAPGKLIAVHDYAGIRANAALAASLRGPCAAE